MLSSVALDQPVDANQNPRSAGAVAQTVDPATECFGLLDAHRIL